MVCPPCAARNAFRLPSANLPRNYNWMRESASDSVFVIGSLDDGWQREEKGASEGKRARRRNTSTWIKGDNAIANLSVLLEKKEELF